jgi:hypothetical protein
MPDPDDPNPQDYRGHIASVAELDKGLKESTERFIQREKQIKNLMKQLFPELERIKMALKPARQKAIIAAAKNYLGMKYGWSENGKANMGIDCSHLVNNAYIEAGLNYSYSDTSSVHTNPDLTKIENTSIFNEEQGDLVNYNNGPGTKGHMGLIDPDSPNSDKSILSATTSEGVRYGSDDWFTPPQTNYTQRDVYRLKELMEE